MQCYAKCTDFHFFLTLEDTLLTQIVHRTEQHIFYLTLEDTLSTQIVHRTEQHIKKIINY
jgi:hypothetical protein